MGSQDTAAGGRQRDRPREIRLTINAAARA
jgi:hypothetical protein